ncbi:hypothetical protein WG922_02270 [Ramlibacter sp. AN1015]|uniref:hypothetical protein n=1 Tax=Ramlibacter sp. AN1015 TaxID=3133428 RepID=UPI0030C4D294
MPQALDANELAQLRGQLLLDEVPVGCWPSLPDHIDLGRSACSAAFTAVVGGTAFATGFPIGGAVATYSRHRAAKALGGLPGVVAGALTAPAESYVANASGYQPTQPAQPSLALDALTPAAIFALSKVAPLRPPPVAFALSAAVSVAGSFAGGAMTELAAQHSRRGSAKPRPNEPDAAGPGVGDKALGRAVVLVPFAAERAWNPFRAPGAPFILPPLAIAAGGWAFRNRAAELIANARGAAPASAAAADPEQSS